MQSVIGDSVGLSQSSVSRTIKAVISAIFILAKMDIEIHRTRDETQKIKQDFFAIKGFPNALAAIDCTHIPIKLSKQEHLHLNRKRVHSLNVQEVFMILTSGMIALSVDTSSNNRDSGCPLETCLMTPLAEATTSAERRYNSSHACTRAVIE
ncbi:putative nuclease HARBI1 [Penaeus japonicus]|uniref:putative nuclease HARBI1 n=1 Tax=Penaeus japonicus TaxID=27405 RepID=UPI001C716C57|nr:putative nuclease HARBI1 [Penaeus japonicus]